MKEPIRCRLRDNWSKRGEVLLDYHHGAPWHGAGGCWGPDLRQDGSHMIVRWDGDITTSSVHKRDIELLWPWVRARITNVIVDERVYAKKLET